MNLNFNYKGQTIFVKADYKSSLKKVVESCLSKFEQHFYQELLLFGSNLRLRSRRTQSILNLNVIVGLELQDNDMIIIEPNENLTSSSSNIHTPKRYDLSNIDSNYSVASLKQSDYSQIKNNMRITLKDNTKNEIDVIKTSRGPRYQKFDQPLGFVKHPQANNSPFDRNDTRRSVGANISPKYDVQDISGYINDNCAKNADSDSSISDFSSVAKQANQTSLQPRNPHTKAQEYQKNRHMKIESRSKSAPASPTKPVPPSRSPHTHMSILNPFNVRTIGKKINISIIKKPNFGLGFTIVTRDNQVVYGSGADIANSVVILVNKILANGGAAEDNRLRPGDRLLEINNMPVTSLNDATEKLRSIPGNESVNLLISRVDHNEAPKEHQLTYSATQLSTKQIICEIPLNRNQKNIQQLGLNIISLDEKASPLIGPGVYIHSILENSLASQQGGLKVDDKIIGINGCNINDINVEEAIKLLKKVMQSDYLLSITVLRVIAVEQQFNNNVACRKEQNYYLLPNKMSLEKKIVQNTDNVSHYSSNDSLSYYDAINPTTAFVRESKGRRSMSDKRKAHEDASQYNFYQETRSTSTHPNDERLYSTLPTASRLKKMVNDQVHASPNKQQLPVKPSQIKHLNNPKIYQNQLVKLPFTPNRSVSLRNSPTKISQPNNSSNSRNFVHTPTNEQQQIFNRTMNNSFKKAVQKPLAGNAEMYENTNSIGNSYSTQTVTFDHHNLDSTESSNSIYCSNKMDEKCLRSNSMKISYDKTKNFNLKNFLSFTPNVIRTKSTVPKEKSDTFPLSQRMQYQMRSSNYNATKILPTEVQPLDDPLIDDSTKRVVEWQMKNDDVISKESFLKEQKLHPNANTYVTVNSKSIVDVNSYSRTQASNKNVFPVKAHLAFDPDPYDTIDRTIVSQTDTNKHIYNHPRSSRTNSQPLIEHLSPRNDINPNNSTNTYQIPNSSQPSQNDIYATVNKALKKDSGSMKQPTNTSQTIINKYRF